MTTCLARTPHGLATAVGHAAPGRRLRRQVQHPRPRHSQEARQRQDVPHWLGSPRPQLFPVPQCPRIGRQTVVADAIAE
jgi:hypothetical protein